MRENLLNVKTEYKKSDFIVDIVVGGIALILVAFLFFVSTFWVSTVVVQQTSMTNTLNEGDVLILDKLATPNRGDIIVFKQNENEDYIKRVIAVAGDTVYTIDGVVWIEYWVDGRKAIKRLDENYIKYPALGTYIPGLQKHDIPRTVVPDNCFFVLGDNRTNSTDSRTYYNSDGTVNEDTESLNYVGFVNKTQVKGVVHQFWVDNKSVTTKIFS